MKDWGTTVEVGKKSFMTLSLHPQMSQKRKEKKFFFQNLKNN
jgi:hypothetical protein